MKKLRFRFRSMNIIRRSFSTKIRVCVVGSGPAGFYLTQNLLKFREKFPLTVDIIEKAPVPFGLVRYGVAPDHPEVKNVIHTFTRIGEDKDVRFIGNIDIGKSIRLEELNKFYHIVVLAYGASTERRLNIPGEENFENVFSAKDFVGWYNGVPSNAKLNPKLETTDRALIIGMGNVAIDCARILLSPIDQLAKTDITESALEQLRKSRIRNVTIVARRGPLNAAFTIKELRELIKLKTVRLDLNPDDFSSIDSKVLEQLDRPRKRLTELLLKTLRTDVANAEKTCSFKFNHRPKSIHGGKRVEYVEFESMNNQKLHCDLLIKSIGYVGVQVCFQAFYFSIEQRSYTILLRLIHGFHLITNKALF